jgi:crotonobetainyl-CoA:carnitine CoA-transferase CaiB-like acyl-CoA transferase
MSDTAFAVTGSAESPDGGSPGPLDGLRVADLSEHFSGQYASRLLAGLGAQVTLVEPPGGSRLRQLAPRSEKSGRSLPFWHANLSKQSLCAPPVTTAEGAAIVQQLADNSDVIIVGESAADLRARIEIPPRAIVCEVSDFGRAGPYSQWRGSEMIHQALGGTMLVTGDPDREPLYGCGNRVYYASGLVVFNSVLAALQIREPDGRQLGQDLEVAVAEVAASMAQNGSTVYEYNGTWAHRGKYRGLLARIQCADGWVVVFGLRHWSDLCDAFRTPQLAEDPRFKSPAARMQNWPEAIAILQEHARSRPADEIVATAQRNKACVEKMHTLGDVLSWDHLAARHFLDHLDLDGEKLLVLGAPWRMSVSSRWTVRPAPPLPDCVTSAAPSGAPGQSALSPGQPEPGRARARGGRSAALPTGARPLDGVTVLDFTSAWAGPMATRTLAFLGAKIIKIEGPTKLDSWRGAYRGGDIQRFPDLDPGERPFDRNAWFNTQNHDKLSVGVNMRKADARQAVLAVAARCDVVIANFSPGTMSKLGLGYEHLTQARPDVIMVEMPALGNVGPAAHHVGMGPTMEAAAGMTALMGYGDGSPVLTGTAYLDPIGGLHGAAAVLSALEYRRRTGRGQYVEVPQVEAAMHWIGEYLAAFDANGHGPQVKGNARDDELIHLAVPTAGDDEWLVVACTDESEWHGLCTVLNRTDWAADEQLSTPGGRAARLAEIEASLRDWAGHVNKHSASGALQAHGVRAAPVANGRDLAEDPHMWARGFFVRLAHPDAGTYWYPGLPYHLNRTPGLIRTAAPRFGFDSWQVLAEYGGLNQAVISQLTADGVITSDPVLD